MPDRFDIAVNDLVRFEQDPVADTVDRELANANGNSTFDIDETAVSRTAQSLASIFDSIQPPTEVDPLSSEQRGRQRELSVRADRLQEIPRSDQPIARRIEGNPYSIEIGPGLRNLAGAVANRERQARVQGDPQRVERAERRAGSIEEEINDIAEQLRQTDDPREERRLRRKFNRLDRRRGRVENRADRYRGFAGELSELNRQEELAEQARETERERVGQRTEFVAGQVGEIMGSQRDVAEKKEIESTLHQNRISLEQERQRGRIAVQNLRGTASSAQGRAEYTSAVNNYARTNLEYAKNFDDEIAFLRKQMLDLSITDQSGDEQIQAEYDHYQERIEELTEKKNQALKETMQIYENSSVLAEGTRVRRKPTENQKELFLGFAEIGASESQLRAMADGMGVEFDLESLGLVRTAPEEGYSVGYFAEQTGLSEEEYVQTFADEEGISVERARELLEEQIEALNSGDVDDQSVEP